MQLASLSSSSSSSSSYYQKESRNHFYCISFSIFLLLFLLSSSPSLFRNNNSSNRYLHGPSSLFSNIPSPSTPSFAFLLSGSSGDGDRLFRLLFAVYHPRNIYLLHIDAAAPDEERIRLARRVVAVPAFRAARNVHVVGRPDFANPRGSAALASTLHSVAILLRLSEGWDWFVNLQASDYPLVTQDDLLHVFSFLPKDLNFIQHTSHIGWRESRRYRPIVVDPGLYLRSRVDIFYATQKRELPNAFKLFTGSSSFILTRKFLEYCIMGTNNLPRHLLMYHANTPSSHTDYFHTVLCNSPQFNGTVVNHDLHYIKLGTSVKREMQMLTVTDLMNLTESGAAFGRKFSKDYVLDVIDKELLNRAPETIVPGGWCLGKTGDPCSVWGNADILKPSPRVKDLVKLIVDQLDDSNFYSNRCIWD